MKELSDKNFGLLIAYLLPGFTAIWGMGYLSPTVHAWLGEASPDGPTVGGFLYVTLGSVAAGLTVSTVRWAVIDTFHHWTGLNQPQWDFAKLQANIAAYHTLCENHYRYYQFYANMVIALIFLRVAVGFSSASGTSMLGWSDIAFAVLLCIFFAGSRDTLNKYYSRLECLLGDQSAPQAVNSTNAGAVEDGN